MACALFVSFRPRLLSIFIDEGSECRVHIGRAAVEICCLDHWSLAARAIYDILIWCVFLFSSIWRDVSDLVVWSLFLILILLLCICEEMSCQVGRCVFMYVSYMNVCSNRVCESLGRRKLTHEEDVDMCSHITECVISREGGSRCCERCICHRLAICGHAEHLTGRCTSGLDEPMERFGQKGDPCWTEDWGDGGSLGGWAAPPVTVDEHDRRWSKRG